MTLRPCVCAECMRVHAFARVDSRALAAPLAHSGITAEEGRPGWLALPTPQHAHAWENGTRVEQQHPPPPNPPYGTGLC